ncbi:hypothetical protein SAMN02910384_01733 [Pseudobutyrivibrio sp. ACV-2]|uniref:hypothetical protein n=1 Tax=Pseudobutyrivibrio sp. ACV-2 TaxID=1520801 RepID=UPI0008945CB2|nr:hypothetical protein [Pseudobutyrivibrio sp. ACV-2]SEA52740.1 hypothetical protein SAMN02910384_01733 [Pseudobutyrivibrio sp. ACV-2]
MYRNDKKYKLFDLVIWIGTLFICTVLMFVLVYKQASNGEIYHSDIGAYIDEMLGIPTDYSFPYPIMFKTAALLNKFVWPSLAMSLTVTGFNILALIYTRISFRKKTNIGILATFSTVALFFCSMIYNPLFAKVGIYNRYVGVFTHNAWHNATYLASRPFIIGSFIYGAYTMLNYESDFEKAEILTFAKHKNYLIFSLFMFLVTMTKPAYTLPHMAVVGIVAIYRLLKMKFKNFRQTLCLALTYVPTLCVLLYQYAGVFTGTSSRGEDNGIGICLGKVWLNYVSNLPLAIILAAGFPIVVLLFHIKQLRESEQYRFGWQIYLAGLLMAFFLYEKGFRAMHFNFAWGYICGLFVVFFVSLEEWCIDIKEAYSEDERFKVNKKLVAETIALLLHLICGVCYFMSLLNGGDYL